MNPLRATPWLLLLITLACGKSLEKQTEQQVRTLAGANWDADQVRVTNVRQKTGGHAIADVTVTTAVTLRQENGRWLLDEIRLDDQWWEKIDRIVAAIQASRTSETDTQMNEIRQSIDQYREAHGHPPQTSSFVTLIDELNPRFLDSVIRLDGWRSPYAYRSVGPEGYVLTSPGPDRKLGTADDIILKQ